MDNVDRLVRLTNNLLNFEKLESGKMTMVFNVCNMQRILREVIQFMKVSSGKHGVELIPEIPEPALEVFCDEDKLKEVFLNLLDNSLKYSPAGGRIWLRLKPGAERVSIEVEDEGIGIKKEEQAKIFEIFSRGTPPGLAWVGGTGVGLAVCKWIVDLHKGKITVDSAPGKGTTFRVELPSYLQLNPGKATRL
jgi:signal transduction histidine kinase